MTLTLGSLFSGIGGLDLGLERAGFSVQWQVEINPYAQKVLQKHWPNTLRFADIRECGAHNLPRVNLIAGGFPCQDISDAGKRAGISGKHSGLWSEFARIISELQPDYALLENVSALLGRGLPRVLSDLAEIGYDAQWHALSAAHLGAPHIRDRIFILAYPQSCRFGREGESDKNPRMGLTGSRQGFPGVPTVEALADANGKRRAQRNPTSGGGSVGFSAGGAYQGGSFWATEPAVGRVVDGVPNRVDRLRGLGNAVVPQVAEFLGHAIMDMHARRDRGAKL